MKKIMIFIIILIIVGCANTKETTEKEITKNSDIEITYRIEGGYVGGTELKYGGYSFDEAVWSPDLVTEIKLDKNKLELKKSDDSREKSYSPGPPQDYIKFMIEQANFFELKEKYVYNSFTQIKRFLHLPNEPYTINIQITVKKGNQEKTIRLEQGLDGNIPDGLADMLYFFNNQDNLLIYCKNDCNRYNTHLGTRIEVLFQSKKRTTQNPEEILFTNLVVYGNIARLEKGNEYVKTLWKNEMQINDIERLGGLIPVYVEESRKKSIEPRESRYMTNNSAYVSIIMMSIEKNEIDFRIVDPKLEEEINKRLEEQFVINRIRQPVPELPEKHRMLINTLIEIKNTLEQNCAEKCVITSKEEVQKQIDNYNGRSGYRLSFPSTQVSMGKQEDKVIAFGVKNVESKPINFGISIDLVDVPEAKGVNFIYQNGSTSNTPFQFNLDSAESKVYPITVETGTDTGTNSYSIKIWYAIKPDSGTCDPTVQTDGGNGWCIEKNPYTQKTFFLTVQ